MRHAAYHVDAEWDPGAEVWVATSEDVPGLVTEAETLEVLAAKLRLMVPDLLAANGSLPEPALGDLSFELRSIHHEHVELAS